jgi:hypothetical protein
MSQGSTRGIPIDTDTTLSADSNLLVPSQKAVKTYVDGKTIVDATPTDGSSNAVSSNGVFDALALKQDRTSWVDYSATSTIVGWSSFTTKVILYKIVDDMMFVIYNISGTSNATTVSFTYSPNNSTQTIVIVSNYGVNNGSAQTTAGRIVVTSGTNSVSINTNGANGAWIASGTKTVSGSFTIKI